MTVEAILGLGFSTVKTILFVVGPILLVGLTVGLTIAIFQATTQIQEMTLTFIPKMIAMYSSVLFFASWILDKLMKYTITIFTHIDKLVG